MRTVYATHIRASERKKNEKHFREVLGYKNVETVPDESGDYKLVADKK